MKLHQRHDDAGDELRLPAGVVELLVDARRTRAIDSLLVAERLDDLVAGVHLLDVAVELAERSLLRREVALRALGDRAR